MSARAAGAPLLKFENISKRFPGVQALKGVDFELYRGEIHALLGANGAGKSTLMKILAGAIPKDGGRILIDGEEVDIHSPQEAQRLGIGMVYQELSLIPTLSVAENIFIGSPFWSGGRVRWPVIYSQAKAILSELGCDISPHRRVDTLSMAEQQLVKIAKVISRQVRIVLFDEPTSALSQRETERLFEILRRLKEKGVGIIYVSHRLPEVLEVSDRVTVLRDGQVVATVMTREVTEEDLVRMMVGRDLTEGHRPASRGQGAPILRVEGLCTPTGLQDVSFELRAGEILGIFGAMGAGRTELARALFGLDPITRGQIWIDGRKLHLRSPRDAIRAGIGYLPEDRRMGLVLGMPILANVTLASLSRVSRLGVLRAREERQLAGPTVTSIGVAESRLTHPVGHLSGGNQQKVALARWLVSGARILIFDEPTRGIDVGAKADVYALLARLASEGTSIIVMSSELPEVLGVSHRVLVMKRRRIVAEFDRESANAEAVLQAAIGGDASNGRYAFA